MASRVEFAVSATPIASVAAGVSENVAVDTIAEDIGKSLGGSASIATDHTTVGYGSSTVAYHEAEVSGGAATTMGSAGYDFVFIKNTGFQHVDATTLGESTDAGLVVTIAAQALCTIPAKGAIVLPTVPAAAIKVQSDDAAENIAVEFILST
jgi:hypothetical protein